MIRIEAIQLQHLASDTVSRLDVADTVMVTDVHELTDGTWGVRFEDRHPGTRFPVFDVLVQQDWSPEQACRELRLELRKKLWICPLCQRRGEIRRMVDHEAFRVECGHCGRFEIDGDLLDHLRQLLEGDGESGTRWLPRLAEHVRNADRILSLSIDTWREIAGKASD